MNSDDRNEAAASTDPESLRKARKERISPGTKSVDGRPAFASDDDNMNGAGSYPPAANPSTPSAPKVKGAASN